MIEINELCKSYGRNLVLQSINVDISRGEVYCLLGKNGAGKTTLINLMLNLIERNNGSIQIFDKSIDDFTQTDKGRIGSYYNISFKKLRNNNLYIKKTM